MGPEPFSQKPQLSLKPWFEKEGGVAPSAVTEVLASSPLPSQHAYTPGLMQRPRKLGMVMDACDPSTQKAEVGELATV